MEESRRKKGKTRSNTQKCKFCSAIFDKKLDYLKHIEDKHSNNAAKNEFMCSDCGRQFGTKSELTVHIKSKCGTVKPFKCKVCDKNLMSPGSLYTHMIRHGGVRSFMCRFCAKLFYTAGQLKVHERIHTQDKAFICEICNKGFCHRQSLITHNTLHTGIKPYQCENCGKSFSCVGNLLKHRKTHADTCGSFPLKTHRVQNPSTKYKVKINTPTNCKLRQSRKNKQLQEEIRILTKEVCKEVNSSSHDEDKEETEIEDCRIHCNELDIKEEGKCSGDKEELDIADDDNISPYCWDKNTGLVKSEPEDVSFDNTPHDFDDCEITEFENNKIVRNAKEKRRYQNKKKDPQYEEELAKFMDEIEFQKKGFGICQYCNKKYTTVRWLFRHIKEHEISKNTGTEEESNVGKIKCSCCKMIFRTKEDCINHQRTDHADILTCQECEKMFGSRDSLRSHQKVFHKGFRRKVYMYICEKCGKQFKQKSDLTSHENRNCTKGPSYECRVCHNQFANKYIRNTHMRVHDPEKKLSCKFCSKSFHWKGQLKIHERSHTGEKPFACLYCPKSFAYRESLITHSTIHTGIKPHLCEGCGSRFSCIGNLIKHKTNHAVQCGSWTYKSQKATCEKNETVIC